MVMKKTVLDCINVLMFDGKTISNTEYFKGKANAEKMWVEAISVTAKSLTKWADDNCVGDTMFKEVTADCKKLTGYEHRYITTALYDEALKMTHERLEEANRPKYNVEDFDEPNRGRMISPETNFQVVMPWWNKVMKRRPGTITANMPTEEQIKWMADKLNLDYSSGDARIVIKCYLNDYRYAKDNGLPMLTNISVQDGKAFLSYVGDAT